jgi:hypothetical protein
MHLIQDLSEWADGSYQPGFLQKSVIRLAFIGPLVVLGFVWINHTTHVTCLRIHEVTSMETKVVGVMLPDCFVNEDGKWKPADRLTSLELDVF